MIRGTIFAPYGRDADVSAGVPFLDREPRTDEVAIGVTLAGTLGHRQLRVRTPRALKTRTASPSVPPARCCSKAFVAAPLAAAALIADGEATDVRSAIRRTPSSHAHDRAPGGSSSRSISPWDPNATAPRRLALVLRRRGMA
jgi:hypothetical protein